MAKEHAAGRKTTPDYLALLPSTLLQGLPVMLEKPMPATTADQPEKKKSVNASFVVAAIAAIITPGAYLLGLSYYQGYMSAFGVEPDGFTISAPDVYVFSYQTVGYFLLSIGEAAIKPLDNLLNPPMVYWVVATLCLCVGGIYWLLKVVKKAPHPLMHKLFEKIKQVVSRLHWKNNDFTKSVGIVGMASYGLLVAATFLAAVALFWWLFPLSAYAKGKVVATEKIKLFNDKGCQPDEKSKWDNCFRVLDEKGNVLHEGLLIAMNDKVIAIFKKDGSYVFTRKDDFMLRRKLH